MFTLKIKGETLNAQNVKYEKKNNIPNLQQAQQNCPV